MDIDELILEALRAKDYFWFVRYLRIVERTDATVTLHFIIGPNLLVQIFYSQRSERLSFALIVASRRLYGRDREHGYWHRHPFEQPEHHEPNPEGMSPQPVIQFLAEVEEILVENDLI